LLAGALPSPGHYDKTFSLAKSQPLCRGKTVLMILISRLVFWTQTEPSFGARSTMAIELPSLDEDFKEDPKVGSG